MALIDNLILYYKCDESSGAIVDAEGSNDGTYNGSLYSQTGKINTAIGFDGTNDEILLDIDIDLTDDFTIQWWLNIDTLARHIAADTGGGLRRIFPDATNLTIGSSDDSEFLPIPGGLSTGSFVHLVLTRISGTIVVYKNASASSGKTLTGTVSVNTLGGKPGGATGIGFYDGDMDEVAIWDRGLSSGEVAEMYNSGDGFAYPFVNDVTISPSAFTLSTTATSPSLFIDIPQSSVFALVAGLPTPNVFDDTNPNKGSRGTKEIRTSFPVIDIGEVLSLVPEHSNVLRKNRVGLDV